MLPFYKLIFITKINKNIIRTFFIVCRQNATSFPCCDLSGWDNCGAGPSVGVQSCTVIVVRQEGG